MVLSRENIVDGLEDLALQQSPHPVEEVGATPFRRPLSKEPFQFAIQTALPDDEASTSRNLPEEIARHATTSSILPEVASTSDGADAPKNGAEESWTLRVRFRKHAQSISVAPSCPLWRLSQLLEERLGAVVATQKLLLPRQRGSAQQGSSRVLQLALSEVSRLTVAEAELADGAQLQLLASTSAEVEALGGPAGTSGAALTPSSPPPSAAAERTTLGFDAELRRAEQRAGLTGAPPPPGAGASASTSGPYGFRSFRTLQLPGVQLDPPPSAALALLQRLASDPGIAAVMQRHQWSVGALTELPPEGRVGVSPVCLLGFNRNRGEEICLRLRTDDLLGFRKFLVIRETLVHELAHMQWDDHDNNFKALNSQLRKEVEAHDWTRHAARATGEPSSLRAAPSVSALLRPPSAAEEAERARREAGRARALAVAAAEHRQIRAQRERERQRQGELEGERGGEGHLRSGRPLPPASAVALAAASGEEGMRQAADGAAAAEELGASGGAPRGRGEEHRTAQPTEAVPLVQPLPAVSDTAEGALQGTVGVFEGAGEEHGHSLPPPLAGTAAAGAPEPALQAGAVSPPVAADVEMAEGPGEGGGLLIHAAPSALPAASPGSSVLQLASAAEELAQRFRSALAQVWEARGDEGAQGWGAPEGQLQPPAQAGGAGGLHSAASGGALETASALCRVVGRLLQAPQKATFRRLRRSNEAVRRKLLGNRGAVAFLRLLGFGEEGEWLEVKDVDPARLYLAQAALQERGLAPA